MTQEEERMVRCTYIDRVTYIPVKLFQAMAGRVDFVGKKFIHYKDGPRIYDMSERKFKKLAHDAKAVYRIDRLALVKIDIIDEYLGLFAE